MFVLKRNQIIITALIIMIAVAGYLNYQDSKSAKKTGIQLTDQGEVEALVPSKVNGGEDIGIAYTGENDNPSIATNPPDTAAVSGNNSADSSKAAAPPAGSAQAAAPSADSAQAAAPSADNSQTNDSSQDDPGKSIFVYSQSESTNFITAKFDREQARSKQKSLLMDIINNTNLDQDKKAEAADNLIQIQKRIEKESAAEAMIEAKGFGDAYVRIDDNSVDVLVSKSALTEAEIAQITDIVKRKTGMIEDQIRISTMKSAQ